MNVKTIPAARPARPVSLAAAALMTPVALLSLVALGGCSSLDSTASGDTVDYRSSTARAKPLDVPPDLSQLSRDTRYQPQGGVVSAAAAGGPAAASTGPATVALNALDGMKIERQGNQRWLVVPRPPEEVWPQVRAFWEQRGFSLQVDDATTGMLQTNWAENRAKLPNDFIRSTIGRVFGNTFDTGERDQFKTRVERNGGNTEITIAHRGLEEVYTSERRESTTWKVRASDPQLEAELLTRLMVSLGAKAEPARAQMVAAPEAPTRARVVGGNFAALEVDDTFDRAWRRVGLALDRGGFTVEDRDRASGIYYVRWVDPKFAGKEEPGWWDRLVGGAANPQAVRYRIALKGAGDKTVLAVLTSAGGTDVGENGKKIATQLASELR